MSKGLRLSLYGIKCTVDQVELMTHALGYNSCPVFNGWGSGGYRNFIGLNKDFDSHDRRACDDLVSKGIMNVAESLISGSHIIYFNLTDFGKMWFRAFKRVHPRADWRKSRT